MYLNKCFGFVRGTLFLSLFFFLILSTGLMGIVPPDPSFSLAAGYYQTVQNLTITSTGASRIFYTVSNTNTPANPDTNSVLYTGTIPLSLDRTYWFKAIAYSDSNQASGIVSRTYYMTGTVQLPPVVFTPAGGTYQTSQSITLNNATTPPGATLRYTLDGTEPNELSSPVYATPIQLALNSNTTIRVKAFLANWTPSTTASASYLITGQVAMTSPYFTPVAGNYTASQNVTINTTTVPAGATIRYTIDGTEPSTNSLPYTTPINVGLYSSVTIKAKAFLNNWLPSNTVSGAYDVTGPVTFTGQVFNPPQGLYYQSITIQEPDTNPTNAVVRYTTSTTGTAPDPSSTDTILDSAGLQLNTGQQTITTNVKLRAFASGYAQSSVQSATYILTGTVPSPSFNLAPGVYLGQVSVVLSNSYPTGSVIRYTTDGTEPTESSTIYNNPIILVGHTVATIKAKAYFPQWLESPTATATYTVLGQVTISNPEFNPEPGYVQPGTVVQFSGITYPSGAVLKYTLNGDEPTLSSDTLAGNILLALGNHVYQIKIRAFFDGYLPSEVITAQYTTTGTVDLSSLDFSPGADTFNQPINVSITGQPVPADAVLRYTINGENPTETSPIYTGLPIHLPGGFDNTIKVKGFKPNWTDSEIMTSGPYIVSPPLEQGTLALSLPSDTYYSAQTVYITGQSNPQYSEIRYTTDGSDPSNSDYEVYNPTLGIELTTPGDYQIRARAYKPGWQPSPIFGADYLITGQVELGSILPSLGQGVYHHPILLRLEPNPDSFEVRYTLDGTDPGEMSYLYQQANPISLNLGVHRLRYRAFREDWLPSEVSPTFVYTVTDTVRIAGLVPSLAPGLYNSAQSLTIWGMPTPSSADLKYESGFNLDPPSPSPNSPSLPQIIELSESGRYTIKIQGFQTDWAPSDITTLIYDITGTCTQNLTIILEQDSLRIEGDIQPDTAKIHYSLDGSEPSSNSPIYESPIPIEPGSSGTIKTRAIATDWLPSTILSYTYTNLGTIVHTCTAEPDAGSYSSPIFVNLSKDVTPLDAELRFTLNESTPTVDSPLYSYPIYLGPGKHTIKAKFFKDGWVSDSVYVFNYRILDYAQTVNLQESITFNGNRKKDYRLLSVPAQGAGLVSSYMTGSAGYDWRVYAERGRQENDDSTLQEWSSENNLAFYPGGGYWVLSKDPINIDRIYQNVPLSAELDYEISLHPGWNIISNPFVFCASEEDSISWGDVLAHNGRSDLSAWSFSGAWNELDSSDYIKPYEAYYCKADSAITLRFPYLKPEDSLPLRESNIIADLRIQGSWGTDRIKFGLDPEASDGIDEFDRISPPAFFCEHGFVTEGSGLKTDVRRPGNQIFEFRLLPSEENQSLRITSSGTQAAVLWDKSVDRFTPLGGEQEIGIPSNHLVYAIVTGDTDFINALKEANTPQAILVSNPWPNPFSSLTSIKAQFDQDAQVSVDIYNLRGQLIRSLARDQRVGTGTWEWVLDGNGLGSGIYFCKLRWQTENSRGQEMIKLIKIAQ